MVSFENGTIDVAGLDAGTLGLEVRAKGYARLTITERTVVDDELWDLGTLPLAKGETISGRIVVRGDDVPIGGAVVRILRDGGDTTVAFVLRDWIETVANEEGDFAISGLTSGPQVVLVEAAGFAPRVSTLRPCIGAAMKRGCFTAAPSIRGHRARRCCADAAHGSRSRLRGPRFCDSFAADT